MPVTSKPPATTSSATQPTAERLTLDVDAELSLRLARLDVLLSAERELLARLFMPVCGQPTTGAQVGRRSSYAALGSTPEGFAQVQPKQVDDNGTKLRAINCSMMPVADCEPAAITFTSAEIELMAEMEHERC